MSLTPIQRRVASVLAPFRGSANYVAGGVALNRDWPRLSDDMDIFRDDSGDSGAALPDMVKPELDALRSAGFLIELTTEDELMVEAILRWYGTETRVQWLDDPETAVRFFEVIQDEIFGFRLHQADSAVNKVLCGSNRDRAARDAVDLVNIVQNYCPLGPLIYAIPAKNPDRAPLQILRDLRKNIFGYSDDELRAVRVEANAKSIGRDDMRQILMPAFDEAAEYLDDTAPIDYGNVLFVDEHQVPVAADEQALIEGRADVIKATNFRPEIRIDPTP